MDVTERKTREETIREQETELRQILDLTPQLIAVYGANRERLYINRIALDYLGLSLEEWRQTREWGAFVHPDDRARERDYFDRALSTGSAYELELRLRKADGSYRWFLARSTCGTETRGRRAGDGGVRVNASFDDPYFWIADNPKPKSVNFISEAENRR
jgi:formate hydrogenlyase transcriptional activator